MKIKKRVVLIIFILIGALSEFINIKIILQFKNKYKKEKELAKNRENIYH